MNEIELIKKYIGGRIAIEIIRGEEEKKSDKGRILLNDKVSRWKQRLIRINQQLLNFCDLPVTDKEERLKGYIDVKSPQIQPVSAP